MTFDLGDLACNFGGQGTDAVDLLKRKVNVGKPVTVSCPKSRHEL